MHILVRTSPGTRSPRRSHDLYTISKSLGHSNLQMTEQYLKSFDRGAVAPPAAKVWGS